MELSDYLAREGLKQAEFAARVGVSEAAVSRWANKAVRPSWAKIRDIATVTNGEVTAVDFMPSEPPRVAS